MTSQVLDTPFLVVLEEKISVSFPKTRAGRGGGWGWSSAPISKLLFSSMLFPTCHALPVCTVTFTVLSNRVLVTI